MRRIAVVALASALALTACGHSSDDGQRAGLDVVASFYPLQYAAELAGGSAVDVTNLTVPGSEPHDLELSPKQIASLADADVVVYLKGLQPAVDEAITQAEPRHVIEVSQLADLLEAEHDEAESEAADEHEHGSTDPHFWLDPERLAAVVTGIGDELSAIDSEAAGTIQAAVKAGTTELDALDGELTDGLANCAITDIVVTHSAFSYLTTKYGLTQVPIVGLSPDEEASPARIAEVQQVAKEHGVTTIFFETLTSNAVAESIATDLGLKTAVLDPVEGIVAGESAGDDYPAVMRSNLQALRAANSCD